MHQQPLDDLDTRKLEVQVEVADVDALGTLEWFYLTVRILALLLIATELLEQ